MSITFKKDGFGQVEPNHLSAPRDGGVWAQLPADENIDILENGMFVKYDYANDKCDFDGDGAWMLVFNEEKLYDERYQMHKHYAMQRKDFYDGEMYPRVLRISRGDLFTTNMFADGETLKKGDMVAPGSDGILTTADPDNLPDGIVFQVVKEYTMPDGQPAVKLQCIKE
jgi:hypothetical protein